MAFVQANLGMRTFHVHKFPVPFHQLHLVLEQLNAVGEQGFKSTLCSQSPTIVSGRWVQPRGCLAADWSCAWACTSASQGLETFQSKSPCVLAFLWSSLHEDKTFKSILDSHCAAFVMRCWTAPSWGWTVVMFCTKSAVASDPLQSCPWGSVFGTSALSAQISRKDLLVVGHFDNSWTPEYTKLFPLCR